MNRYEKRYWYSFKEVLPEYLQSKIPYQFEINYQVDNHYAIPQFPNLEYIFAAELANSYNDMFFTSSLNKGWGKPLRFMKYVDCSDDPAIIENSTYLSNIKQNELLFLIINRYYNEYVFSLDEEVEQNNSKFVEAFNNFRARFMNIILMTYPKYSKLLDLYASEEQNLVAKLSRTTEGNIKNTGTQGISGSNSNIRKDNDTPQGSGDFSDDTHTSFLSKDNGSTSSTRTDNLNTDTESSETWDNEPIIDRLKKIQDSYKSIMADWVEEFRILFVEGGNLHEI